MVTAKKIETDVGGATMKGMSVRTPPIIDPMAHVMIVDIMVDSWL